MLESHSHFLKAQRQKKSFKPKLQPLFFLRFRRNSCFQAEGFSSFFDAGCIRLTFRTFFHPRRMMKAEPSCRLFGAAIFYLEGCVCDDFIALIRRHSRDAAYVSADGAGCGARIPAPAISPKHDEPADGTRCGHHARRVVLFAPCARADVRAVPPAKPAPDVQRRISARRAARAVGGCAAFTPDAPNAAVRRSFFFGQLSGAVEPLAGILGALLAIRVRAALPLLLSLSGGAMVTVILAELLPECQKCPRQRLMVLATLAGFVLMMALDTMGIG